MEIPKTLYHYCSTSTFQKIIEDKTVRLSALSLSNDSMEGKLVGQIIKRLAIRDSFPEEKINRALNILAYIEDLYVFGFCLSAKGDILSQWRGYADDGAGVSIGFSVEHLKLLSMQNENAVLINGGSPQPTKFNLRRVEYEGIKQEEIVQPMYQEILKHVNNDAYSLRLADFALQGEPSPEFYERRRLANQELSNFMNRELLPKLYELKSNAFEEEGEWRLLSHYLPGDSISHSYRTTRNSLIAHRDLLLDDPARAITHIFLGPKHLTPEHLVEEFLALSGIPGVQVRRSIASYR